MSCNAIVTLLQVKYLDFLTNPMTLVYNNRF